jgi:hypothetical protein
VQQPPRPARRSAAAGRRLLSSVLLALGSLVLLAPPAQARPDVQWSVTIGGPAVHAAPVYVQPAPVIYGPPAHGYHYYERGERWRSAHPHRYHYHHHHPHHGHHHHHHRGHGRGYRDSDRDGVPDRWDRRPENPWRR